MKSIYDKIKGNMMLSSETEYLKISNMVVIELPSLLCNLVLWVQDCVVKHETEVKHTQAEIKEML